MNKILLFLLLICLLGIGTSCSANKMTTREKLVLAYLGALAKNDGDGVLVLCAPDHTGVKDAVDEKLKKLGGKILSNVAVEYFDDISPVNVKVEITGTYQDSGNTIQFQDDINLVNLEGRWYLLFGKYRDAIDMMPSQP